MRQSIDLTLQNCMPPAKALDEQALRIQLAATYRLIDKFRMSDLVETHISVRLPGTDHFLLNPYGMMFHEITASSLLKVDLEGNLVEPGSQIVNPAGFVIHSAIHAARTDISCVLHTHSRYGTAVSLLECGLLPVSQFALQFYDRLAYHDYEGVSLDLAERERLVNNLGKRKAMIMRNHRLLTAGRTIPEAFILMYYLEKSCEIQILAQSSGSKLVMPSAAVCQTSAQQQDIDMENLGQLQWGALMRLLDRDDSSYRD
ncbi:MAG: class II aldolase/adducin family protein [Drouetiella hepatica Uher 2000/2452]|jgi:ribulose-5-phosphate 4-epimerase/fuculose-1-phosphate aldolase|uniref:Class II aldolase/adducin family protein n=1 Tax=Drouetiella hepatica Uher 2000/2452 TaxID=904376 RepID=A0A951Q6I2_9CYAN|nr:class II aldolase/adducin family protein [Drouetiella hepatica Uher 2000/2452]